MNFLKPFTPPPPVVFSPSTSSFFATEGKKQPRRKDLCDKHGHKLHPYEGKAPYPLSYDRPILELEALDNRLTQHVRNSISFVDFEESPSRVLDLGCGSGNWVINAAKEWPNCKFVGFDLVDVQLPLKLLEPSIAMRIEWWHGNFLTTQLPFDDDEFDYVHIQTIARGVPENKWGMLLEEVSRVLRPGGVIEFIEEDIIFPTFPQWFSNALRARPMHDGNRSQLKTDLPSHDHALLGSLHTAVYENRFINTRPLSILPSYFTIYFRQVDFGLITNFPMPPLPPIQPPSSDIGSNSGLGDAQGLISGNAPKIKTRAPSEVSQVWTPTTSSGSINFNSAALKGKTPAPVSPGNQDVSINIVQSTDNDSASDVGVPSSENECTAMDITAQPLPARYFVEADQTITRMSFKPDPSTLRYRRRRASMSDRSLAMHLYKSYQLVIACREAMWEELRDRIRNRREELVEFGWDDDEELQELNNRQRFEKLIERYEMDMKARLSLWRSLEDLGFKVPRKCTLTKAELVEEERLRESMIEARKQATKEEMLMSCRATRVMVGHKPK